MQRTIRSQYEGVIYHVYQRCNNKDYIFKDSNGKVFLLKKLKEKYTLEQKKNG